jgi:hypothetical protein
MAVRPHHGARGGRAALLLATLMILASMGTPTVARAASGPTPVTRPATTPVPPPAVQPRIATANPIAPAAAAPTVAPAPTARTAPSTTTDATAAPIPTARPQVVEKPTAAPTATAPPIRISSTGGAVTGVSPSSGLPAGGTNVTITGSGFWKFGYSVTFDGVAATNVTFVDSNTITCTTPAHAAGTVAVGESDSKGTATALSSGFTYVAVPTVTTISPASGPLAGGAAVTIIGTALTDATAVTFGGTNAASFTVNSDTQITAITPAKAVGPVTVAVMTAGGTGSKSSGYTYVAAPTVTGVSPASGPAAGGTGVTITGTNLTGATVVKFDGIAATGVTVVSATSITATTPADAAGAADVAVTTAGGTGTKMSAFTYIGTLAITAAPGNFSYSANLTGDVLPLTSSFAVGVDAGGTVAGWNLQASIGALKTAGGDTIPAANHTIRSVAVTGVTGAAPTNGITYPLAIPTASGKIYNAAAGTGTGQATVTFNTQVAVPADAAAGTYTATLTVTIAAGP